LLSSKYAGGAEILKEVYKLTDQGKRNLGLRYDLTVPFAKVIASNKDIVLPFRRYEIGKVYRDGPVKVGRDREFYQCDVDVCGIAGSLVEAEFMTMICECYKKLGIDIYIEWNNRKLLSGLILVSGIDEELVTRVILSVDKLAKIGEDGVFRELEDYEISRDSLNELFNYFKLDINTLDKMFSDSSNEILKEGIKEVKELTEYINKLGIKECIFTPYLARGLEIYTGTVWEVFDKQERVTCSIGAGGRYDKIITNFVNDGKSYPAVGMTFGLVPIYEILTYDKEDTNDGLYDLYIVPLDTEIDSLTLANKLRKEGIKVILEMNNKKVKKALDWANRNKIPYVMVIGENEIRTGKIEIRDMFNSNNIEVDIGDIEEITKLIKY
jgi:histidyl-tRNA synthetase